MNKLIEMLMVEDNPGDVRLSQEYLKEYNVPNHLSVVKDGVAALGLLNSQAIDLPDIILISIRMLWQNKDNLLKQIQHNALMARIPLVILTAFDGEETCLEDDLVDILCVPKPLDSDCWAAIVKHLVNFGLTTEWAINAPKPNKPDPSPVWNKQATFQNWRHESGNLEYA